MKVLIAGANGFLGSNLINYYKGIHGCNLVTTSRKKPFDGSVPNITGDLLNLDFVKHLFDEEKPDFVINTVSLANVDECEEKPDFAREVVVETARNVSFAAAEFGIKHVYISTDHLYDGSKNFYSEEDTVYPVNNYGRLKLEAENVSLGINPNTIIVRTNFFGWSPPDHMKTFGEWVYSNLLDNKPMTLFTDYYFTPIEVSYLSEILHRVILGGYIGIINIAGTERCSKFDFGITLAKMGGFDHSLITGSRMDLKSFKVRRPGDLSLSTYKLQNELDIKAPDLSEGIKRFLANKS